MNTTTRNVHALCRALELDALRDAAYAATGTGAAPSLAEVVPVYRGDCLSFPTLGDALLAGETAYRRVVRPRWPDDPEAFTQSARYAFTVAVCHGLNVTPPTVEESQGC